MAAAVTSMAVLTAAMDGEITVEATTETDTTADMEGTDMAAGITAMAGVDTAGMATAATGADGGQDTGDGGGQDIGRDMVGAILITLIIVMPLIPIHGPGWSNRNQRQRALLLLRLRHASRLLLPGRTATN